MPENNTLIIVKIIFDQEKVKDGDPANDKQAVSIAIQLDRAGFTISTANVVGKTAAEVADALTPTHL